MELLIILEKVKQGELRLSDLVTTETEAARTGGSQVFLRDGEQFTLDDLLYALMVHSANDAAVALAIHAAGSTAEFVRQMNQRAAAIGMQSTHFISVHGLPPANTITPDTSTPRDLSLLARELLKYPDTLRYTGCREKNFREGERAMIMVNHNRLLSTFQGCDGLKTGFFRIAGYSIVATALQNEQRFIVVVGGSQDKKTQYKTVQDLLTNAFLAESK
jgi:D-alanyl-D-alanine carboxypeptidase (penicillin-binding protein 5/6)